MVFGRELRVPCDVLFGAPPEKKQQSPNYAIELVEWLHDVRRYPCQYMKTASNKVEARYYYNMPLDCTTD
jgi:hypothetical protein